MLRSCLAAIGVRAFALTAPSSGADDLEAIKTAGELRVLVVEGAPAFVSLGVAGRPQLP